MTDKVQKIREEVERLQNELIQEKEKGYGSNVDDACILELQNVLTYIDSLQEDPINYNNLNIMLDEALSNETSETWNERLNEEPANNNLEKELDKYIQSNFTIDTEQLDRFSIEEKDYMYSMDKSDMLALVEHFINWHKTKEESVSDDLEEAMQHNAPNNIGIDDLLYWRNGFIAGAKWQKEQNKQWLADNHKQIFNNGFEEGFEAGRDDMEEQLKKDAVECKVKSDSDGLFTTETWDDINSLLHKINAKEGDKVKLIFVKED